MVSKSLAGLFSFRVTSKIFFNSNLASFAFMLSAGKVCGFIWVGAPLYAALLPRCRAEYTVCALPDWTVNSVFGGAKSRRKPLVENIARSQLTSTGVTICSVRGPNCRPIGHALRGLSGDIKPMSS
jgi:hypothetical protein